MINIKTSKKLLTSVWQIGNYIITIHTSQKIGPLPFQWVPAQKGIGIVPISIYLEENKTLKEQIIHFCEDRGRRFFPIELVNFYNVLNKTLGKHYSLKEHINKYYIYGNKIFAIFPYHTDDFVFQYSYKNNEILLWGNKNSLYRLILDLLTVSQKYIPLHASSIKKNKNCACLVSDSGCGKTSLLIQLLKRGYSFISDDSVFANDSGIFPVSKILTVRKDYPNHPKIEMITKRYKEEKIVINIEQIAKSFVTKEQIPWEQTTCYYLQKSKKTWKGLKQMLEPFPCIAHHSFWCMFYWTKMLGTSQGIQESWLQNKIENSVIFWEEKLQEIKPVTINLDCFEQNADDFAKEWVRWSNDEKNVSGRL